MEIQSIEQLVELIKDARISELTVTEKGCRVTLRKPLQGSQIEQVVLVKNVEPATVAQVEKPKEPQEKKEFFITAPMVGIFHSTETIKSPGVTVAQGQVVGAIESMKLMNEVVSDVSGVITEILIDDGMPVEYGQPLFRLSPLEQES